MIGKHNQAVVKPTVQDIMAQAAAYGAAIPQIIGTVLEPPLITWLNGIIKHTSKKSGKKGAGGTYSCQIDVLLGHNPIQTTLRCYANGPSVMLGLGYQRDVVGNTNTHTVTGSNFYCVMGVTATIPYSYAFADYGSPSGSSGSGSYEIPLWNTALQGPDPTNTSGARWSPYTYYCAPGSAVVSDMHVPGASAINVYWANIVRSGWGAGSIPLAKILNMAFESSLGDGSEYASPSDFSSQQIIYPWFAGAGSTNFDLGSGAAPQMKIEVMGSSTLYPEQMGQNPVPVRTGLIVPAADADFADMIESVVKQGLGQAALLATGTGTATGQSPIHTGCSSFDFPGAVQKKFWSPDLGSFGGSIQFDVPVTQGNTLVVAVAGTLLSGPYTISDSLGNSWTAVENTNNGAGFWYAQANASGPCQVTLGSVPSTADVLIFELAGGDTVDASSVFLASVSSLPTGSITTTQAPGQQAYILTWVFPDASGTTGSGNYPFWKQLFASKNQGGNFYGVGPRNSFAVQRVVSQPGTYSFNGDAATGTWKVVMLAIKNATVSAYPKAFASLLDESTLNQSRMQCRANGLWGSLLMNHQKKAADWLKDIYDAAVTAPVWSGFKLKSVPRSEVSAFGNGAVYTAPTASGPVVNLGPDDMIGDSSKPLVAVVRKAVTDRPDLQRLQYLDRDNDYRTGTISQPDPGSLTQYGLRYATPRTFDMIQHANVAQMVLGVMVRRQTQLVNEYQFDLQARFKLLEAMDLVTITDPLVGINQLPVRLKSVEEDDQHNLKCTAEDYIWGTNAPRAVNVTASASPIQQTQAIPSNVNAPVFFEPPSALTGVAQDQLWIGVSDSDPLYGGSQVYVSVDGGATYVALDDINGSSVVSGNATTGNNTADWPQALDPDTTNDLAVDLSESLGQLSQYTVQQEDQFLFPCYIAGAGIYPFELFTYAEADLTGAYSYLIRATGGGGVGMADLMDWVMISYPLRTTNHMSGPGVASYNWLDADGLKYWLIKNSAGNPWDIVTYDATNLYKYITENADTSEPGGSHWSSPTAFKRHVPTPMPFAPRFMSPTGGTVTVNSAGPNSFTRTLSCESDGEPLLSLGAVRNDWTFVGPVSFGGSVGTQPALRNDYYYGSSREQFYYVQGLGLIEWTHASLIGGSSGPSGTYLIDQTSLHNILSSGGCPTPNFPCYSSIPGPGFSGSWIGGVPGAGGNIAVPTGTSGTGNKIRRAVFGTWVNATTPNTGSDHPNGSRFLFVDPSGQGIFKVDVLSSWIGKTLYFKFVQFNIYGGGANTLANAVAYPYTILGGTNGPGGGSGGSGGGSQSTYTISPTNPLSQTSSTNIHMVNVTASWSPSGLKTFYVARNFTIVAPVAPTTYWVTVYDPNQTGDTGATATLTAYCANTQATAHVGQPGYIYMGNIVATSSGTGAGGQGGGSNPSGSVVIQIPIPSTTRGDFTIAHGLGTVPSDVDIKIQSNGLIRFQSPTMWDSTNVYLNASDDGLVGTLVIEL